MIEPPKKIAMNFKMGWAKLKAQPENGLTCHFLKSKPSQLFGPSWGGFPDLSDESPSTENSPIPGVSWGYAT